MIIRVFNLTHESDLVLDMIGLSVKEFIIQSPLSPF